MKATFTTGTAFAGYRVDSLVGRGGMGVVYRATDLSLGRPVALKLIAPELSEDERFRARFLREPRLAASLDHPNVIPIYEAGEHEGQLYLAMRYVEGTDLKTTLERDGKLAPDRTIELVAQVASALDAAHERALVHRDVKPGNVLIDRSGHVYLTDFGITKQTGADSTETGSLVGTLDYLAPEQIRGEPVDARTDSYALACVLYECLAGKPPFRRGTEAETLWGHMQEDPPPLRGQPRLDRVLRTGLAKGKDARYPSCGALIEAAADALGIAAPRSAARRAARRRAQRPGALLVAGGLGLLVAAAAAIATLGGGGDEEPAPHRNGVGAIDGGGTRLASFTQTETPPGSLAVGEGAVWVLGLEDSTLSRIDPETKKVVKRFRLRHAPTDIAAGAGAVWVKGDGRLARIDPDTGEATRTVKLPDTGDYPGDLPFQNWGFPQVAVGAGAVWAINDDRTVSRIDPDSGRRVARIVVDAATVAAGREGVWFISGDDTRAVTRIDPRTNRVGQTIRVGAQNLSGVEVGAGHVWATAEADGVVWRIDPGRPPLLRTFEVGVGARFLSFGAGAIWTANYIDGTVSHIDVETGDVESSSVRAVQSLAAGEGSAWVSSAAATAADGLPQTCGELLSGPGKPDVLIASDLPLQDDAAPRAMADAIENVLERHDFRAGRFSVGYRSCDDSNTQTGSFDRGICASNATAYADAPKLVAVIGAYNSDCSAIEIPILNRAPGGPLAMISPANTGPGLTAREEPPPWGYNGEPDIYYPTGTRNFVRLPPLDDLQGTAHALLAKQLGLRSVYVLSDGSVFWKFLLTDPFRHAARRLGVRVAGAATFEYGAKDYDALVDRIARSSAQGVVFGGDPLIGAGAVIRAIRARLGARFPIMAGHYFAAGVPDVLEIVGPAARGIYAATTDVTRAELELTPAAERFLEDFGEAGPGGFILESAQATELVLRAIARSDGTRESVLEELKRSRVKNGILGSFRFDRNGDLMPAKMPIIRITGSTPPEARLPELFQGAVIDRVVKIPRPLIR
jgi:ABC-type branched-subunit amino acid transport system substrate-binding protein/streptogramin lyase